MSSNINNTFTSGTGPAPNTQGPHKSDMLNRADPRVDSDLDGSRTLGGNTSTGTHVPEGTYGSHKSRAANVADPRIDSDNDRTAGLNSHGASTGMTGSGMTGSGMTGSGMTGTHHMSGAGAGSGYEGGLSRGIHEGGLTHGTHEGAHGPHSLRAANATDPRVDSDLDGSRTIGNKTGASAAHTGGHSTTAGERVVGATAGTLGGPKHTGPAPNTAGPHKSDFLNKIDPRVDSNLDGSKTFGGDKTYSQ